MNIKNKSRFGFVALILGIVGFVSSFFYIGIIFCIAGIVFSILNFCEINTHKAQGVIGIICSIIGAFVFMTNVVNTEPTNGNSPSSFEVVDENEKPEETKENNTEPNDETESPKELIAETEIYNNNGISITLNSIDIKKINTVINVTFVSNADKDYSFSAHSYAINGLMAGADQFGYDIIELPAGKKAKMSIEIENNWLKENNINEIAELEIVFWSYYDNFKEFDTGKIVIKTALYEEGKMYVPDGKEIYSDDVITIWLNKGTSFTMYNKSLYNAKYTVENCSVNDWSYKLTDYTCDLYDEEIHSEAYVTFELPIEKDFINSCDIETAENIEFNISLSYWSNENDSWNYASEKIFADIE